MHIRTLLLALSLALALAASGPFAARPRAADDVRGRDAVPDYARVFPLDRVNRLDIAITAANWNALLADMVTLAGTRGTQGGFAGGGGGGQQPVGGPGQGFVFPQPAIDACAGQLEAAACTIGNPPAAGRCIQTGAAGQLACVALPVGGGGAPGGGVVVGGGGNQARDDVELLPRNPMYIPADLTFDGESFTHVGFRFKGNSSLLNSWRNGTDKMPFRLNIDGLESAFPDARDQTFFGFTNLSFSNGALDSSYLRAKVVTDLLRDADLPVARTAFIRVFLDTGSGPGYLGLYTMTEVPDSPYLVRLFGSDDGNLYKPNGTGGRWTVFNRNNFPKRTNASDEDWTDIQDAIAAVNASRADREAWRRRIEARFEVNGFLRWLAANTIVGNFDAYGGLSAHNYYLYGSPRHRDRLFWIPWDHDLAMSAGGGIGGGGGAGVNVDILHQAIAANWPLIRFFMDDPVYRAAYRSHVEDLLNTALEPARVSATLRSEQARIAPFVHRRRGRGRGPHRSRAAPSQFDAALLGANGLIASYTNRVAAVRRALAVAP